MYRLKDSRVDTTGDQEHFSFKRPRQLLAAVADATAGPPGPCWPKGWPNATVHTTYHPSCSHQLTRFP